MFKLVGSSKQKAVEEAESRLRHSDLVGITASGRLGLGCVTRASLKSANQSERRKLVQKEVREVEEESRKAKVVSMKKQGNWLRWESTRTNALSWKDIWQMKDHIIGFLLWSVFDEIPPSTNLYTWILSEDPKCKLGGKSASLEHILSSCSVALSDGRYRWRHDKILNEIASHLDVARRKKQPLAKGPLFVNFAKAGGPASQTAISTGILATAPDWDFQVDLMSQLKFPPDHAFTRFRPDALLHSKGTKQLVYLELTVLWEERVEEAHERKKAKYQPLMEEFQQRGWKT